jgi:hypothetical protein
MFRNEELEEHLQTSSTIRLQSAVIAEWNMNIAENIAQVGNYRYRPNNPEIPRYNDIAQSFSFDDNESLFYTGATDADTVIDGGFENDGTPIAFVSKKQKEKMLFSLEDCFGRFRPRSGINKLRYFDNKFSHHDTLNLARRPRYYMSDKNDTYKYWSSYRTEDGIERGIANQTINSKYYIEDAAPYVVYENEVPANRIVVKMQTNVGSIDLGPFTNSTGTYDDPLFGDNNKTTPVIWRIQYLKGDNWVDAAAFNENSVRRNGQPIVGSDGYVELYYGLLIPDDYYDTFRFEKVFSSATLLPDASEVLSGTSFLIRSSDSDRGTLYISDGSEYVTIAADYGWSILDEVTRAVSFVTDLTSPPKFNSSNSFGTVYREFEYVRGLRVVVETMNVFDSTFDLIELSPRLAVDLSDKVTSFSIKKSASDLGVSGLPVGQLLASTGSLDIFDFDQAFFKENTNSIIKDYTSQNIQIKLYEIVIDVNGLDLFVPIKTMYSEGFPSISNSDRSVSLSLRDLFFYFESTIAPQMLIQEASLGYAVSLLLDSVGFSNYVFLRNEGESEDVIPYFYMEPDKSVAEVLNNIARSTQSAMFFDEYNNFVVMSKGYMMPSPEERETDIILYGTKDFSDTGVRKNEKIGEGLTNIVSISAQDNEIFNDGTITYSTRYIQRSYSSIRQASLLDRDKTWIYKPALLWEVAPTDNTKSVNEEVGQQSAYVLSAIPLNSDLSSQVPNVVDNVLQDNIMDFGEGIYWLTRYNGYFYANGEIIKYDAVQYSIPGLSETEQDFENGDNVWISSVKEYQRYFSKIPFNGKIYPTGLVRIYSEPNYEIADGKQRLSNGEVAKHGRGQFGTEIVEHQAGLSDYWTNNENIRGLDMESNYLFGNIESNKIISDVQLFSNSPVAVFEVPDASLANVGEYVEKYFENESLIASENENYIQPNTRVVSIDLENQRITTDKPVLSVSETNPISAINLIVRVPETEVGPAGVSNQRAVDTTRSGVIKNFFANQNIDEISKIPNYPATIQSSALVMSGDTSQNSTDFMSYVYKPLDNKFRHFGTRMRIVGRLENSDIRAQSPNGASTYFTVKNTRTDQETTISGGSGGIGVLLNPETNNGYYFEIAALTASNINDYGAEESVNNVFFYKVGRNSNANSDSDKAIPLRLYSGIANILVDDGKFVGQSRMVNEENTTVYDLAVEYEEIGEAKRFYLYINNVIVGIVDDPDPLPTYNNMAIFVRGSAQCMFENVYALTENYSQNTSFAIEAPVRAAFGDEELNANKSFRKYAVSGLIQSTYLSGVSANEPPKYNIYFEEFGTIMREAAYFDVRYDKAYPALSAKISPTFNRIKGYTVSGFTAGSYGAEFLVFNNTDTALALDSTSGNYLRIQGVTFTQQSDNELSVDEYFDRIGNLSDPEFIGDQLVRSPEVAREKYRDIKLSRLTQGRSSFSIDATYIQSQDTADSLMTWLTEKIMQPRKSVGVEVFGLPILQLGDIVQIKYTNENGVDEIAPESSRFVVYYMDYDRKENGPSMNVYLSEVL